jgi:hypothetical protein
MFTYDPYIEILREKVTGLLSIKIYFFTADLFCSEENPGLRVHFL